MLMGPICRVTCFLHAGVYMPCRASYMQKWLHVMKGPTCHVGLHVGVATCNEGAYMSCRATCRSGYMS